MFTSFNMKKGSNTAFYAGGIALFSLVLNLFETALADYYMTFGLGVVAVYFAMEMYLRDGGAAKRKRLSPSEAAARPAEDKNDAVEKPRDPARELLGLIQNALKAGDPSQAHEHFTKMTTGPEAAVVPDAAIFKQLLSGCARAGDVDRAAKYWALASKQQIPLELSMYNSMIGACAKAGDLDKAESWLSEIRQADLSPDVHSYTAVITACTRSGNADRAEAWMQKAAEEKLANGEDAVLLSAFVDCLVKSGKVDKAELFLEQCLQEGKPMSGIGLTSLLQGFAKTGNTQKAEFWMHRALHAGVKLDAVGYNSMIGAAAQAKDLGKAEKWMAAIREAGQNSGTKGEPAKKDQGAPEVNVVSFNTLLSACTKTGNVRRAEELIRQMIKEGPEPNQISFGAVIAACAKKGDVAKAEGWLGRMCETKLRPNLVIYNAIVDACAKSSNLAKAEAYLFRMMEEGVDPDVISFNTMIDACAKAKEPKRALTWLHRMTKTAQLQPTLVTFCTLISAFASQGDVRGAEEVLQMMPEHNLVPDTTSFNALMNAYSKASLPDRVAKMEGVLEQMKAKGVRPSNVTYASLARPFAQKGDWTRVDELFEEMEAARMQPRKDPYLLNTAILAYSNGRPRQIANLERRFRECQRAGCEINNVVWSTLVRAVGEERANYIFSSEESDVAANPPNEGPLRTSLSGDSKGSLLTRASTPTRLGPGGALGGGMRR